MDVTSQLRTLEKKPGASGDKRKHGIKSSAVVEAGDGDSEEAVDPNDDFKREMHL